MSGILSESSFHCLQICFTTICSKMQPWFTKIFFLWQAWKSALNYPKNTLFVLHGSFRKMFMRGEFLECFSIEFGLLNPNPGRKKSQHAKWYKKNPIFLKSVPFLHEVPYWSNFRQFFIVEPSFPNTTSPWSSQSVHKRRLNYFSWLSMKRFV